MKTSLFVLLKLRLKNVEYDVKCESDECGVALQDVAL